MRAATSEEVAARLLSVTSTTFGVSHDELCSDLRGDITTARWALSYVLSNSVGWNQSRIGRLLQKDHAAIAYGLRRANDLLQQDEEFFEAVKLLEGSI